MTIRRLIKIKRSFRRTKGNLFFSAGWGRYGPYALLSRKISRKSNLKISGGLRGIIIGGKYKPTKRSSISLEHNLTTKNTSVKVKCENK